MWNVPGKKYMLHKVHRWQFFIGLQSHRIYRCMKGLSIENTCRMKNLSLISMVVFLIPVHDVLWVTHMEGKIPID